MHSKNPAFFCACIVFSVASYCSVASAQLVATNESKPQSDELTIGKMLRIGVPNEGFSWTKPQEFVDEGEKILGTSCRKEGSDDYLTLLLMPDNATEQSERREIAKGVLDGDMEVLRQSGATGAVDVSGPEANKKYGSLIEYRVRSNTADGRNICAVTRIRFGKLTYAVTAYSDSLKTASKLCDVIETAKVLEGEEFEQALASFRRFRSSAHGFSIVPPLNMKLEKFQKQSVEFRGRDGLSIRVYQLPPEKEADFDKQWKQVGEEGTPPGAVVVDEGSTEIDGMQTKFKTYSFDLLHGESSKMVAMLKKSQKNPDDNELWGTLWLFQNDAKLFVVKAHCYKRDQGIKSDAIMEGIKGIRRE